MTLGRKLKKQYSKIQSILTKIQSYPQYKVTPHTTKPLRKAKRSAFLRLLMLNRKLERRVSPLQTPSLFILKLITYRRVFNKRGKKLLIGRFFMHNMLWGLKSKQKKSKATTLHEKAHSFSRRFSYYRNTQGLFSIFNLVFFSTLKTPQPFNLINNLFINDKTLSAYLVKLYSEEVSETLLENKTFFFNFSKKKLDVYKVARETH